MLGRSGQKAGMRLAWVSSLLLHAGMLLVAGWWVGVPQLLPPGHGAVEVNLVQAIPGRGEALNAGKDGRQQAIAASPITPRSAAVASAAPRGAQGGRKAEERQPAFPSPSGEVSAAQEAELAEVRHFAPPLEERGPERSDGGGLEEDGKWVGLAGGWPLAGAGEGEGGGPVVSAGEGNVVGGRAGPAGAGGVGGGGADWRQLLRDKIERAKRYPPEARRSGIEGTAEVQFRVVADGRVEDVTVVKSSGFPILDQASVDTIKRAAPLPVIPGTIRVGISYRLRDRY